MNKIDKIPYFESEMSQFTRFFSGKFQNLGICAGVNNLTNIIFWLYIGILGKKLCQSCLDIVKETIGHLKVSQSVRSACHNDMSSWS